MTHPKTRTFFCEKMGAGKSTQADIMTKEKNAVLLSEDENETELK